MGAVVIVAGSTGFSSGTEAIPVLKAEFALSVISVAGGSFAAPVAISEQMTGRINNNSRSFRKWGFIVFSRA